MRIIVYDAGGLGCRELQWIRMETVMVKEDHLVLDDIDERIKGCNGYARGHGC